MVDFDNKIYQPNEIGQVLDGLDLFKKLVKNNRKALEYYQVPCAFDIETSSYLHNDKKQATMYVWQFAICGKIIIGRTWQEFISMMDFISKKLMLWQNRRLMIFVHNYSFEFSFIKRWFKWEQVFNMEANRPLYAVTKNGFEFRCSYLLSNASLATVAKENIESGVGRVEKLVGELDYKKIRNCRTPLTQEELDYCINDVKILIEYIDNQVAQSKSIFTLPYTNTGRVRTYVREKCNKKKYKLLMETLTLDVEEYSQLKRAFQGGFTHGNASYIGRTIKQDLKRGIKSVLSYDFTSSYPAVMISEFFPMSKATYIEHPTNEQFTSYLKTHCCLFDVYLTNVRAKYDEHIISVSHCEYITNHIENNGRVVEAKELITTVTEQDWFNICDFYDFDDFQIADLRVYKKGLLPKEIIEAVLELYQKKTTLKEVAGSEIEYAIFKGMLNSLYGMIVTDICREVVLYNAENGGFDVDTTKTTESQISDYNENKKRFLFYPWGVWVTAYARRNLFSGILATMKHYLYADTDSIKIIETKENMEEYKKYFDGYNSTIVKKIENVLNFYNLDIEQMRPKNKDGKTKQIGIWDFDGEYKRFKTLGAKRYLVEKYNEDKTETEIILTVSGLNKYKFNDYIEKIQVDPFEFFVDEMEIEAEYSGKNTHIYINEEMQGTITDYLGNTADYYEKSGMWMGESEYKLTIGESLAKYLMGARLKRY